MQATCHVVSNEQQFLINRSEKSGRDMAARWYYQDRGLERGPLTAEELRRLALGGQILPSTLVQKDASGRWVLARRVRGLFDGSSTLSNRATETPPNLPTTPQSDAQDPPVPTNASSAQTDGLLSAKQVATPPPLPSTSLTSGAIPVEWPEDFLRRVRAQTCYPNLRSFVAILRCLSVLTGASLAFGSIVAFSDTSARSSAGLLVLTFGGGILCLFTQIIFHESSSLMTDIADVLIEQTRRSQKR
jgi:hypothetical protein